MSAQELSSTGIIPPNANTNTANTNTNTNTNTNSNNWKSKRQQRRKRKKEQKKKIREDKLRQGGGDPAMIAPLSKRPTKRRKKEIVYSDISLVIDLQFQDLMTEKEVTKLHPQLALAYGATLKITNPFQLYFTSFKGKLKDLMQKIVGWENWKVTLKQDSYIDVFNKADLIYLTADSPESLEKLETGKVYIVGGLLDHNRLKGVTYKKASEQGIATARLPINQYMAEMKGREVLTSNQVVEILSNFLELSDWRKSFEKTVPPRKWQQIENTQNALQTAGINTNSNLQPLCTQLSSPDTSPDMGSDLVHNPLPNK